MILTLERRGLIQQIARQSRSIEVLAPPNEMPPLD
jgi:hypothetical protein